jgi:phenylacetic acid degradation operon negative regulatory protein
MHKRARKKLRFRRKEALLLLIREIGEFAIATLPQQYPEGRLWRDIIRSVLPDPSKSESLRVAVWRLEKEGFLERIARGNRPQFRLTAKGLGHTKRLDGRAAYDREPRTRATWDGKWRVIIFDVPERFKEDRRRIREALRRNDFYPLQKSVWISPWRLSDELHEHFVEWKLKGHILYLLTETIDEEAKVLKKFGPAWGL